MQRKKFVIGCMLWAMGTLSAFSQAPTGAAGTEFYFTILDHWFIEPTQPNDDYGYWVDIYPTASCAVLITQGSRTLHRKTLGADTKYHVNLLGQVKPLESVHVTCTQPCYVNVLVRGLSWAGGTPCAEGSPIYPTHLLGKHYMLQGFPGDKFTTNKETGDFIKTYSQCTIVGTQDGTTVTIEDTKDRHLQRVNGGSVEPLQSSYTLNAGEVLLFQPNEVAATITGVTVDADKPIAVFQGNPLAQIQTKMGTPDYLWEQVRPIEHCGKEFMVLKSIKHQALTFCPMALYDNTTIEIYTADDRKWINNVALQKGNSLYLGIGPNDFFSGLYMVTSQPVLCYLYTQGISAVYDIEDCTPSMAEVAPIDIGTTEARWTFPAPTNSTNTPYSTTLIVSTEKGNDGNVTLDGTPINALTRDQVDYYGNWEFDRFVSYEIPLYGDIFRHGILKAKKGKFSAYILHQGKEQETASFNITLGSAPIVRIDLPRLCKGDVGVLTSEFDNDGLLTEPVEYQWFYSSDNTHWLPINGATDAEWKTGEVDESYAGWYMLGMYSAGHRGEESYGVFSESEELTIEDCDPPLELCKDGVLLFREDFGGNDPNDPVAGTEPVPGMSDDYHQIYDTASCMTTEQLKDGCKGMSGGAYLLTKKGYRNASTSYNFSHWFIMDDHTHQGDFSRGYFLEIDGRGSQQPFYRTTIGNLCAGTRLSFSAYVANVSTPTSYLQNKWRYAYPRLKFILTDPTTGAELASYDTDTIPHDWRFAGSGGWRESAHWRQVGTLFTVPEGVNAVELTIQDNAVNGTGNDFAIDDIEVYACFPPVKLVADSVICKDERNRFELSVNFSNNNAFVEPIVYQWFFSTDTTKGWEEITDYSGSVYTPHFTELKTGWYQVAVSGAGNKASKTCSAWSEPFHLRVDSSCVDLCDAGVLLLHEDIGANTSYSATVDELCAGSDLTFVATVENGEMPADYKEHEWLRVYPRLDFTILDATADTVIATHHSGNIPYNSGVREYGKKITVPEGMESVRLVITNTTPTDAGIDFRIIDVEIRHCMPPLTIQSAKEACRKEQHLMHLIFKNDGSVPDAKYQWAYSADSITWTVLPVDEENYLIPAVHKYHEGWYRATVASGGAFDNVQCREISDPVWLGTKFCGTPEVQNIDTTVCDTLMPVTWRHFEWPEPGMHKDTVRDPIDDDDSLYLHLYLHTKACCPDVVVYERDTALCDTLLPFLWIRDGNTLLFEQPGTQEIPFPHHKWLTCTGEIYRYTVDTFRCERKWPFLVNKYDWQLLVDHTALHRLFPERTAVGYRWYKNDSIIAGATTDEYCEQDALNGAYFAIVQLDDGSFRWSNMIVVEDARPRQETTVRIYDCRGVEIPVERMTHGIYLLIYQQGDRCWTEKRYIP